MKKLIALFALMAVGCATGGSIRHQTTVSVVTAHSVLSFLQDQEMGLVCGKPSAPAPPACVNTALHHDISGIFVTAFDSDGRAATIAKALPDGAGQPADLVALLVQIEDLVKLILDKIPASPKKAALERDLGR